MTNFMKYSDSYHRTCVTKVLIDTPEFTGKGRKLSETVSGKNVFVLVEEVTCKKTGKVVSHKGKDKVASFPSGMITFAPIEFNKKFKMIIEDDKDLIELFKSEEAREESIPTVLPKDWKNI